MKPADCTAIRGETPICETDVSLCVGVARTRVYWILPSIFN